MSRLYSPLLMICTLLATPAVGADPHWSFRPRGISTVPALADPAARNWVRTSVDAFILERLRGQGLKPSPEADRATLIRRLSFDLTGLPPTPEEISAFVNDSTPDAYERLVERLLDSSHYGERWAQHWLDVVRFAESDGFEYDRYRPGMWRYRDYVIKSLMVDKPYDRFVREQLAGDHPSLTSQEKADGEVAIGFLRLGPVRRNAGNQNVASSRNEVLTEMTDAVGMVFLGLTVGCARCHDHKFDDFSQEDYYRLQAFMAATYEHNHVLVDKKAQDAWQMRTTAVTKEMKRLTQSLAKADPAAQRLLEVKLKEAEGRLPPPLPAICTVQEMAAEGTAIHVLKRGLPEKKGARVEPGYPTALVSTRTAELPAEAKASPRLALAQWLTDPAHPLTARVFVNRVWQYHFGRGLVETPNDFGVNGSPPSHPKLLDYLANEFIDHDMRLKPLHRLIVLSATYRQASNSAQSEASRDKDP
ncbi:MAG TPA: DUF1549 and DUF1553 domain-containing protein, partial [Gemmataceae bacterium]|nr:DUF1549 and DUF1553 domain-containing protein [Gemmataceae bacterium]